MYTVRLFSRVIRSRYMEPFGHQFHRNQGKMSNFLTPGPGSLSFPHHLHSQVHKDWGSVCDRVTWSDGRTDPTRQETTVLPGSKGGSTQVYVLSRLSRVGEDEENDPSPISNPYV